MIILMILSMVGFKGEYLKIRQVSQNPTLRLSLLKSEQNQTSYLMENNHSESLGVKTKKRNKLKYVALETAGGMIGGSIAALGTYFYVRGQKQECDFICVDVKWLYPMLSHIPGSVIGTYITGKALKEKGSFWGLIVGTFLATLYMPPIANIIVDDHVPREIGKKIVYGIFVTGVTISGVIGYNYKTLL